MKAPGLAPLALGISAAFSMAHAADPASIDWSRVPAKTLTEFVALTSTRHAQTYGLYPARARSR